jgi:predicted phosphodiesterase
MIAVISDIHSNTAALAAVLADIANRGVKKIICLGDVVGYGPDHKGAIDLVMSNCEVTLMGNHDYAVLYEPVKFNTGAESACFWTRQQLEDEGDAARRSARWDFLGKLQVKHAIDGEDNGLGDIVFLHGSPRRPVNEYIFPDDIYNNPAKIQGIFDRFNHVCFVGHTHVPGIFTAAPDFYSPDELEDLYEVDPRRKVLINVGSVGQPRDRDNRACYVLIEEEAVRFVRVEYDVEAVAKEVYAIPELDDYLGTRLKEGR